MSLIKSLFIHNSPNPDDSFWAYLDTQKKLILLATLISLACFILLKYCFPYPDFFVDSLSYLLWAYYKWIIAYRPMGYSFFLQFIHGISSSAVFTVFVQYFLFFISTLFCFFSADYLFRIPEKIKWVLLIIILINPMLLFQTNLISSDSLFCSLTVIWFTCCLWILRKHNWLVLILQILFLYLCYVLRYSAILYPIIAVAAFVLCTSKWLFRITGIALTLSTIFFTVEKQKSLVKSRTSVPIFSGFSGWQIANNALYCYKKINIDPNDLPSEELQVVDHFVKMYIDTIPVKQGTVGTAYMWATYSPLKACQAITMQNLHMNALNAWYAVSQPLGAYGWYIVRNYPGAFARYYILPNTINFFYPDREALTDYNVSNLSLSPEAKDWFKLDMDSVYCRFPDLQPNTISVFPAISLLLNVFNILTIFFFLFKALPVRQKIPQGILRLFIFWIFFYFTFMAFTIFATSVNLRFMDPVFILGLIFPFVLLNALRTTGDKQPAN